MSSWFPNLRTQKKNAFLVLRIGTEEIDFLMFQKEGANARVITWGSEDVSYFTPWQVLEKIFSRLPQKQSIRGVVATFPEKQFNAQVVRQVLPPILSHHMIDKAEASAIERDALARANRMFQQSLFRESGILPSEFTLRRVKFLDRAIDGYPVPKLDGFKRGEIELSILGVFLLEPPFLSLERFAKAHKIPDIRVVHIAEAIELFAREHRQEGIYLHVEERETQIAVSSGGRFSFPGSIPMGSNDFNEFFTSGLGMREPTAEVFERHYFQGDLSLAVQEKLQGYLLPEIRKFGTLVKEKLLDAQVSLPDSIWIFGRGRALRKVERLFNESEFADLPFSQKPLLRFFSPSDAWAQKGFPNESDPKYTTLCLLAGTIDS